MRKGSKEGRERIEIPESAGKILGEVIEFLQIELPETLAKRLVAIVLLAIGISKPYDCKGFGGIHL